MGKETPDITYNSPATVELIKGEEYHHCTCNLSKIMPYCDGAHIGTDFIPITFIAKKSGTAYLCQCQKSSKLPYCDSSHSK